MSGNESGSSDREKSPSLMRSNNDQRRRSKEVSPKVGEPRNERPKKKKPKSRSKFSNDRRLMKKEVPHRKVEEATSILKQEKQKEQASEIFTFAITIKLI